jgi:hypothetical protein
LTVRLEVVDGKIEAVRYTDGRKTGGPFSYPDLKGAMSIARFWIKLELARDKPFVTQIQKEARRAFKQMAERSPFNGSSKK